MFNEINVGALQKAIDEKRLDGSKPVDVATLIAAGVVRRAKDGLRLLGDGELKAKIAITVNHASAKAKAAVEKAGGSVTVIEPKILAADEAKRKKSADKKAAPRPRSRAPRRARNSAAARSGVSLARRASATGKRLTRRRPEPKLRRCLVSGRDD